MQIKAQSLWLQKVQLPSCPENRGPSVCDAAELGLKCGLSHGLLRVGIEPSPLRLVSPVFSGILAPFLVQAVQASTLSGASYLVVRAPELCRIVVANLGDIAMEGLGRPQPVDPASSRCICDAFFAQAPSL